MQQVKKFKDPIYEYITIPQEYITKIVDTPVFQRLRRVAQTSYPPLYASALHNRFVHSIGVYHLGEMAAKRFKESIIKSEYLNEDLAIKYSKVYTLACLLHDVGHAPFSHTSERGYRDEKYTLNTLHKRLCSLVNVKDFENDLPPESAGAAEHEIMSAIIGIKEFGDIIGDDECKELFARCITGYTYEEDTKNAKNGIKNCFIRMLNSKVIDVDRLDYLIRDAYTSGFKTVNIDYKRLLDALTIDVHNGHYRIVYNKAAVSVIENVVYAHDAERKWIQNHPTIIYEVYILSHILDNLAANLDMSRKKLMSENSLSVKGQGLKKNIKVSLLSDDDIIYLAKNAFPDDLSKELFDRNSRMHPVWKSEEEYKALIGINGEKENFFLENITDLCRKNKRSGLEYVVINDSLIESKKKELSAEEKEDKAESRLRIKRLKGQIEMCSFLVNKAKENDWGSELLFIKTSMFNSNFRKEDIKKLPIVFGKDGKHYIRELEKVCNLLNASDTGRDFCYLFYRRGKQDGQGENVSLEDFCDGMIAALYK